MVQKDDQQCEAQTNGNCLTPIQWAALVLVGLVVPIFVAVSGVRPLFPAFHTLVGILWLLVGLDLILRRPACHCKS